MELLKLIHRNGGRDSGDMRSDGEGVGFKQMKDMLLSKLCFESAWTKGSRRRGGLYIKVWIISGELVRANGAKYQKTLKRENEVEKR